MWGIKSGGACTYVALTAMRVSLEGIANRERHVSTLTVVLWGPQASRAVALWWAAANIAEEATIMQDLA